MKRLLLAAMVVASLAGCSQTLEDKADTYNEVNFDLCSTEVKVFSYSDDGRIRVICKGGERFMVDGYEELETMRGINASFCMGAGLKKFASTKNFYNFQCTDGEIVSIRK